MSPRYLLILSLLSISTLIYGQGGKLEHTVIGTSYQSGTFDKVKPFSIDVSLGSLVYAYWVGGAIELYNQKLNYKTRTTTRASIGFVASLISFDFPRPSNGINYSISQQFMFGSKVKFLELGAGVSLLNWRRYRSRQETTSETVIIPSFNIGYRREHQKSKFRVGIGYPEMIYIGYGL